MADTKMDFVCDSKARVAMAAWAETTTAPALALVNDPGRRILRILEADLDGTLVVRHQEKLIDTIWTPHSKGITGLTLVNAYSVVCCHPLYQVRDDTILVPHGTTDLKVALDQAMADANDCSDWKTADDGGETFIDAISEGRDVDPWRNDVPVPDEMSEDGPLPIVLVRMAGGRIDNVHLVRGHAHVVVVNRDGEGLDRGPHLHLHDDQGEFLLTHWTGPNDRTCLPADLISYLTVRTDPVDSQIPSK